jgi:hypothetical protein
LAPARGSIPIREEKNNIGAGTANREPGNYQYDIHIRGDQKTFFGSKMLKTGRPAGFRLRGFDIGFKDYSSH